MQKVNITYKGQVASFDKDTTYYEVSQFFGCNEAIAVQDGNEVISLDTKIKKDASVDFLDVTSLAGYKIYQSGLKFLFYLSVKELYPDCEVSFLHSVPKGILSEVIMPHNLTSEDVSKIKGQMAKNVAQKLRFIKYNLDIRDAYQYLKEKGEIKENLLIKVSFLSE